MSKATKITVVMNTGHGRAYTYTLSELQADEMRGNEFLTAEPDSIHPQGREPERFVLMARKSTVDALVRMGLGVHAYRDWPEGWRTELTVSGLAVRKALNEGVQVIGADGGLDPYGTGRP